MSHYKSTLIDSSPVPVWEIKPPPPDGKKSKAPKFEAKDTLTITVAGQKEGESATLSFTSNLLGASLYSPFTEYTTKQPPEGFPYKLGEKLNFAQPTAPGSLWSFSLTYLDLNGVAHKVSIDPELQVGAEGSEKHEE